MDPILRTLRPGEEEALIELLDGWALPDGWRGRDFFRRYLEHDPSYRPDNVWVAERNDRLEACVQIFPRQLRAGAHSVPTGGIGSVFTRPEARGAGLASALLERATRAMDDRGYEVALLFTGSAGFYAARGWSEWPLRARLIEPGGAAGGSRVSISDFGAERDLAAVRAVHESYSRIRTGTAVRDAAAWNASLRVAGNPSEDFRVARAGGAMQAYARAVMLEGVLVIAELGRAAGGAEALAELLEALLAPRPGDPLARAGTTSAALRARAIVPPVSDPELDAALEARGTATRPVPWSGVMLRCVDADALARRLVAPAPADAAAQASLLRRALPPDAFTFWPADRF